jgi:hypothetical protein
MIMTCSCQHEAQDKLNGKGRRVYNECKSVARCTVCKKEVSLTSQQIKEKNTK